MTSRALAAPISPRLRQGKIIAVLRARAVDDLLPVCDVLVEEQIPSLEFTLTTPNLLDRLAELVDRYGSVADVGVGTVLSTAAAETAMDRGANYLVTPSMNLDIVNAAVERSVAVYPGGLTPTELWSGWQAGASAVKIFPAQTVGAKYLRSSARTLSRPAGRAIRRSRPGSHPGLAPRGRRRRESGWAVARRRADRRRPWRAAGPLSVCSAGGRRGAMITRDDRGPAVLTFGEALVGYATVEESLRVGTQFTRFPGGADLNVAVGLTRLGTRATWTSVLGEDAHGDYLADVIGDLGVEVALTRAAGPTALMFKAGGADSDPEVLQVRTGTAFAEHADAVLTPDLLAFDGLDHLHLTGITLGISEAACATALALLEAARSHGLTVSFDPNLRLNLWPDQDKMRGLINTVASQATIVLPGLGEGALLTGRREPEAIADFYLSAGAQRGRRQARTETERKRGTRHGAATSIPYFVEPVDTVGRATGLPRGISMPP